ncbi:hypothetical protein D4R51_00050 [bacterium]|nr:MAG: hypothetical protein D4R51_00050 [bacterium]
MKKVLLIFVVLLVLITGAVFIFDFFDPQNVQARALTNELRKVVKEPLGEYTKVSIGELINDIDKYEGKKVSVTGNYQETSNAVTTRYCPPIEQKLENLKVVENYLRYGSRWSILERKQNSNIEEYFTLPVDVKNNKGVGIGTLPLFKDREEIELRGTVMTALITDDCSPGIKSKSVFLRIDVSTVPIPEKPE